MNYTLANRHLNVTIKAKGAELASVVHQHTSFEYMWQADPAYWAKSSPVLFPIVGALKDNTYQYKGKTYSLSRHGFARDEMFAMETQTDSTIVFLLTSIPASKEKYPFDFELRIAYQLVEDALSVTYHVKNTGDDEMLFSIGAHPAFATPLNRALQYTDYYISFEKPETAGRWPISKGGLIEAEPQPFLQQDNKIRLTRTLFDKDAIVLKNLQSRQLSLRTDKDAHGLDFTFEGFDYLGLWAQPGADFVCIEPWCGIADSVNHNQQLITKEGIEKLAPGDKWTRAWHVRFY